MKKNYIKPELDLSVFDRENVMTASGENFADEAVAELRRSGGALQLNGTVMDDSTPIVCVDMGI